MVALCDVDASTLNREVKKYRDLGEPVEGYADIRKLLENKDIDVVSFATPNHWHSLGGPSGDAGRQGCDVEKPVSHNVWEGRRAVEVARQLKSHRADRHAVAFQQRHARGHRVGAWPVTSGKCCARAHVLQTPPEHRQSGWPATDPSRHRL